MKLRGVEGRGAGGDWSVGRRVEEEGRMWQLGSPDGEVWRASALAGAAVGGKLVMAGCHRGEVAGGKVATTGNSRPA